MASPVTTVASIEGQAWAKAPDGSLRILSLGSTLAADEVLITAEGARVELDFGEGDAVVITGNQQVGMGPDLWEVTVRDPSEAALADASIQQALTILEQGGDLLEELEETAAGSTDSSGGGGNSFVQIERVAQSEADEQEFVYGTTNTSGDGEGRDNGATNKAPLVEDLFVTLEEDTSISGRIPAQDIENDSLTFTLIAAPAHGTLTLDAVTGEFQYVPAANYFGSDSFHVSVTDTWGNTSSGVVNIDVTPVNDAPVADHLVLHTDEDVAVAGQVIGSDIENDPLTYSLVSGPAHGSVSIDGTTGNFVYTPSTDYHGDDSFDVLVDDGNGGTTTATVSIIVAPVNDAPVATDLHLLTDEDVPVSGQILASDVDGDVLTYEITGFAGSGTVVLDPATGSFTYTPDQDYYGNDSFVVTITDGQGGLTTSTVTIEIAPVNDAPVADNKHFTTLEDTPYSGQITARDVDGDSLSYAIDTMPANGRLSVDPATGAFVYVPVLNYYGGDSFVVVIDDGNGGTTTSTVTIDVLPVNDAPTSSDLYLTTNEDTPVSNRITAFDVDGDTLSYAVSSRPSNGSVSLDPASGNFVYTPAANYTGSDRFVVTVSDGQGGTTTSTVTIGVLPVNDAPVATNLFLTTPEDTPVSGAINAHDPDGDSLTYSMSSAPSNGSVNLDPATGNFVYTPAAGYLGNDRFVVTINDGNGGTATSIVTIGIQSVAPVNQAPTASDDSVTTEIATPITIDVRANDTDPDVGDILTIVSVSQGANGSVVIDPASGDPIYTPNAGFSGSDSFTYTIEDSHGNRATATVRVEVIDNSTVMVPENVTVDEDSFVDGNLLANDSDPDDVLEIASFEINGTSHAPGTSVTIAGIGDFLLEANGDYEFTPAPDYHGPVPVITYTTNTGASSTLTLTVMPVNDAPVAAEDSFAIGENQTLTISVNDLLANDVDIDGDPLEVIGVSDPVAGSVILDGSTITFTPTAGFTGRASFTYKISDGQGGESTAEAIITVTPGNSAPQTDALTVSGDEDTVIQIDLSGSDADGSVIGFVIESLPANGVLFADSALTQVIAAGEVVSGPVYFQPDADWNGSTTFNYAAQDDEGAVDATPALVNIIVNPVADAAVLGTGSGSVKEDDPLQSTASGQLSIYDPDDGEEAFQAQTTAGTYGTLTIAADGSWTYTIDNSNPLVQALKEGETKTELFIVTSVDGTETTITIDVIGTNDIPIAQPDLAATAAGVPVTIAVLGNDSDPDGDVLSVIGAEVDEALGTVAVNPDNTLTFTPASGVHGTVVVSYTISDGQGGESSSQVDVTVRPGNSIPVATDDPDSASFYSVTLGTAGTDSWASPDSKGQTVSVLAFNADGSAGTLFQNGHIIGVAGTPRPPKTIGRNEPDQIEYDIDSNTSESIVITANGNLTSATFSVRNLVSTEAGGEVGQWTAYYKGVEVASDTFRLTSGNSGSFTISPGGLVFDSVRFSALHTFNGTGDGSGYFLTGFSGSGSALVNSDYVIPENGQLHITAGAAANLLANDTDADGDLLTITHVNGVPFTGGTTLTLASGAVLTINNDGSFSYSPNDQFDHLTAGQLAVDSFTYTVSDGFGGTATANAQVAIIGSDPAPVAAFSMAASDDINSTAGSDLLVGTLGADTFKWNLNDGGAAGAPVEDQVIGFNASQGDVLHLADLLQGESSDSLTDYLHFTSDGTHTTIHISTQGGYAGGSFDSAMTDQTIILQNVNLSGSDADIIHQLKSAGNLITD